MKKVIDIERILTPIPGDNPAGEDLRYNPVYDEIKEARRSDDPLAMGEWKHDIKTSDWDKVITLSVDVLTNKTKDIQIAAWLTEGLIMTEGFEGLSVGIKILIGLLTDYWENVYPLMEEGDLEYRVGPFEFINEKLPPNILQIPLTDKSMTSEYSLAKWKESREVGYKADTHNQYGDIDENKKKKRDELIAEGKLSAEEFDSAIALSSEAFSQSLIESITICLEDFKKLDEIIDQNFGSHTPRLAEFKGAIEECAQVVRRIYKDKINQVSAPEPKKDQGKSKDNNKNRDKDKALITEEPHEADKSMEADEIAVSSIPLMPSSILSDSGFSENALWEEACRTMKTSGIKQALGDILAAAYSAPSIREKNHYRLLIAKLCLKADRPDLARPIAEELHGLIEELHLERWESPLWIAEVLDTLYQCLTKGERSDDDLSRARVLFQRLCTMDITKAIFYKN